MDQTPQTPVGSPAEPPTPSAELQAEPIAPEKAEVAVNTPDPANSPSPHHKFINWLKTHKKLSLLFGLMMVVLILAAIPFTRYQAAGLVLKRNLTISVVDSVTGKPVSGATVSADGKTAQTDGSGHASLRIKEGYRQLQVFMQYYQQASQKILVPILSPKGNPMIALVATGRQVDVNIDDLITGDPLGGAGVAVDGTNIKGQTDKSGYLQLVLPADKSTVSATLSLSGYNNAKVTIKVVEPWNGGASLNNFNLVPAGKVYYLSDSSDTLNLMSANLDGKGSKVLLSGTGKEDSATSSMYVSPDNKYVALHTNRDGGNPLIYIVNTQDGSTKVADTSNASYAMYGWLGDKLIYSAINQSLKSAAGSEKIKSYDTATGKATILSQNQATSSGSVFAYEMYQSVSLLPASNQVAFSKSWVTSSESLDLSAKKATFNVVSPDGTGLTVVAKFAATDSVTFGQYSPTAYYISDNAGSSIKYYGWQIGSLSAPRVSLTDTGYAKATNQTYFYSPDLKKTIWSEARNQASATFTGDANGANAKQIGGPKDISTQTAFGWVSNNYALTHIPGGCNFAVVPTNGKDTGVVAVGDCVAAANSNDYNFN